MSPLLALACTNPKKLFIRNGCAPFAGRAPRCPGLADLMHQGAASVGGPFSLKSLAVVLIAFVVEIESVLFAKTRIMRVHLVDEVVPGLG